MSSRSTYDCIVVGAGMAGLTLAALMAQRGERVLVAEQHYLPGGLFTAFKRGGFTFNVAMEWTTDCAPGERLHQLLAELGLAEEYPFTRLELFKSIVSPELKTSVPLYCGAERLRQSLVTAFPHQSSAIDRFLADCLAVQNDPARARELLRTRGLKSVEVMLEDYFDEPLLVHLWYSLLGYPGARGVLLMYLVSALCAHQLYVPDHPDHRRLALLLHRKVQGWGGEIRYRTPVSRILVENGAATGVQLASGETCWAPRVVAGVDAEQLYSRLLHGEYSDCPRATELLGRKPGLSTFGLFLGLRGPLPPLTAEGYAWSLLSDTARWRAEPAGLEHGPLRVEAQSALHPTLAPGKSTLCVWSAVPISAFDYWGQGHECEYAELDTRRYQAAKDEAAEVLLRRLEGVLPELRRQIEVLDTATPYTFKYYTRNREGSVSGFSLASLSYLKPLQTETPVQGLHHIGQWVIQSGVNSVMYSAQALFRSLSTLGATRLAS